MRKIHLLKSVHYSDVNLHIPSGSFHAIIGHTGSGKSTLLQHLNALLKPSEGTVVLGDLTIQAGKKVKNLKPVRQKSALCFNFLNTNYLMRLC